MQIFVYNQSDFSITLNTSRMQDPINIRITMLLLSCVFRKTDRFSDPIILFFRVTQSRNRRNLNESNSRSIAIDTHSTQFTYPLINHLINQ
jgi:hypothetical protein